MDQCGQSSIVADVTLAAAKTTAKTGQDIRTPGAVGTGILARRNHLCHVELWACVFVLAHRRSAGWTEIEVDRCRTNRRSYEHTCAHTHTHTHTHSLQERRTRVTRTFPLDFSAEN